MSSTMAAFVLVFVLTLSSMAASANGGILWQLGSRLTSENESTKITQVQSSLLVEGQEITIPLPDFDMRAQIKNVRIIDETEHVELALLGDKLLKTGHIFIQNDKLLRAWLPTLEGVYIVRNDKLTLAKGGTFAPISGPLNRLTPLDTKDLFEIESFPPIRSLIEANPESETGSGISTINMLFVTSEEFAVAYPNTQGRIQEYLTVANSVLEDSGVNIRIRASGVMQFDFERFPLDEILTEVFLKLPLFGVFSQNEIDTIISQRIATGSDLVSFIKLESDTFSGSSVLCGLAVSTEAFIPQFGDTFEGGLSAIADSADFGASSDGCSEEFLTRVFGFNSGLTTSVNNFSQPEGEILPYGRGHREDGAFRTIMAIEESFLGEPNLPVFSSPENTCVSLPCGISPGLPGEADAVTALNLTRVALANKVDETNPNFVFDTALAQVEDPSLQTCINERGLNALLFDLFEISVPPDVVTEVTSLDCLDIRATTVEGLQNFYALNTLTLSSSTVTDISPINELDRLNILVINGFNQASFDDFGEFPLLILLQISNSNLTSIPHLVSPIILRASFDGNQIASIDDIQDSFSLDLLTFLTLEDNFITDFSGLNSASALETLFLDGNPIDNLFPLTFLADSLEDFSMNVDNLSCQEMTAARVTWSRDVNFTFLGDCISLPDDFEDFDGDGINNLNDSDDDGDGINDITDFLPRNASNANDNDLDGIPNNQDPTPNGTGNPGDGPSTTSPPTPEPDPTPEPEPDPEQEPGSINAATSFDFDGDGLADIAVRRPSIFRQFVLNSADEEIQRIDFGRSVNDIPISGDFDGDGITDIGVRRPSTQQWFILNSSGQDIITNNSDGITRLTFGRNQDDIPVLADFDGDGITDIGVRRPSTQQWFIRNSSGEDVMTNNSDGISRITFGRQASDIPVVADYDGDGRADIAVRRPSSQEWFILNSSGVDPLTGNEDGITRRRFGTQSSDIPVAADFDGDGRADLAVRRPSTESWFVLNSSGSNFNSELQDGIQRVTFGRNPDDIPIIADYDGDGIADFAVRRPSTQFQFILRSSDGEISRVQFGRNVLDIPLAAPILTRMSMAANSR